MPGTGEHIRLHGKGNKVDRIKLTNQLVSFQVGAFILWLYFKK